MSHKRDCYAIDFGTSNSLLSYVPFDGESRLIGLEEDGGEILKSLIFTPEKDKWFFGKEAISNYGDYAGDGRFFRSIKKFLPEPGFKGTEVFGRRMPIEELIATFLREMKIRADRNIGRDVKKVLLGRPAKYSLKEEEDKLAEERMRKAANLSGFDEVHFCPEPLAAGLDYNSGMDKEKIVLIADFGGGTSDFTLLKIHSKKYSPKDVLGLSGVFLAGDMLDGNIMRHFVSSHFGKDVTYQVPGGNNILRFPRRLLKRLCSPAHIVFLKERDTWEFLKEIQKWSVSKDEERILDQLFTLVEEQLGYPVYAKIEESKINLSQNDETLFKFEHPGVNIEMPLTRIAFESSVNDIVNEIIETMNDVFRQSGLTPQDVDHICVTGGTGQSPLIKSRLSEIFGEEKLSEHKVFQSVVGGLAQYAKLI